jgi:hypothetical protein
MHSTRYANTGDRDVVAGICLSSFGRGQFPSPAQDLSGGVAVTQVKNADSCTS